MAGDSLATSFYDAPAPEERDVAHAATVDVVDCGPTAEPVVRMPGRPSGRADLVGSHEPRGFFDVAPSVACMDEDRITVPGAWMYSSAA